MNREEHLKLIKTADRAYYDRSAVIMTDAEYDRLRAAYIGTYGATDLDYVPGDASGRFQRYTFSEPISSLDKVQMENQDWRDVVRANVRRLGTVVVQPKVDGLTMVKVGELRVSRGSGEVGNVYPNAYHVSMGRDSGHVVRGEVYLPTNDLKKINAARTAAGVDPYENSRNAAAGLLTGTSDQYINHLRFIAYNLLGVDADLPQTEQLAILDDLGCATVPNLYVGSDPDEVIATIERFTANRPDLPYDIDGLVVKSNEPGATSRFGSTGHHPLSAIAVKFETDKVLTKIVAIEWSLGRRKVSPIAIFEPVRLCGTTVQRAMVHNVGVITKLGLSIGAIAEVEKSNEIIPQVVRVVKPGPVKLEVIKNCPACGHPLELTKDTLVCVNQACGGRLARELAHVAAKNCLDIFTLSVGTAEKLVTELGLTKISDLWRITRADLLTVEGFAERSADLLIAGLAKASSPTLAKFIFACCVEGVGSSTARDLARHFKTYEAFLDAVVTNPDAIRQVEGVGDVLIANLSAAVNAITDLHVVVTPQPEVVTNHEPRTWVITGTLSCPRATIIEMITTAGDKVASALGPSVSFLLTGAKAGSKLGKARAMAIRVVTEDEFADALSGDDRG